MRVGIELRKKAKDSKVGVLNLRIYSNGKQKYKSLGIELEFKHWNKEQQKVKSTYTDYEGLNSYIDTQLTNFKYNALNPLKSTKMTALEYFYSLVDNYKETTKENYKKTLKQYKLYLTETNQTSIELNNLNPLLFNDFKEFLINKGVSNNTIFTHFAILKSLTNQAINNKVVNYPQNPFTGIKIKKIPPKKTYINEQQIRTLINYNTTNKTHLKYKNIFIFQLFSQGMRIADLLLLKWSNFSIVDNQIKLEYVQSKSKKRIIMNVNPMMQSILDTLFKYNSNDKELNNLNNELSIKNKDLKRLEYIKILNTSNSQPLNPVKPPFKSEINYNDIQIKDNINTKIDKLRYQIESIKSSIFEYKLNQMNGDNNLFFQDKIFQGFKSGNDLNKQQLRRLNSIKGNINYYLKKIAVDLNLPPLSTHIARHSYAMLSLNNNFSIDNLSQALGHHNIKTTYNYIHSLPTNELNNKMNDLANKFV